MKLRNVRVYAYIDPADGCVHYIGQTHQRLSARLHQHRIETVRFPTRSPKTLWLTTCRTVKVVLLDELKPIPFRGHEHVWFPEELAKQAAKKYKGDLLEGMQLCHGCFVDADLVEEYWIWHGKNNGWPLTNQTRGGRYDKEDYNRLKSGQGVDWISWLKEERT